MLNVYLSGQIKKQTIKNNQPQKTPNKQTKNHPENPKENQRKPNSPPATNKHNTVYQVHKWQSLEKW